MKSLCSICAFLSPLLIISCGSIVNGSKQSVGFSSSPVRITLPGYYPYSATLTHSVSGWVWGNLLMGGIIGLAVDASTGGLYVLSPDQVQAQLVPGRRLAQNENKQKNQSHLFVVLNPKPEWRKIDNLRKI